MTLTSSNRELYLDKAFNGDVLKSEYINKFFLRLVAKGKRFEEVDFKYSVFDTCYLRGCVFDSCDFTGCRFIGVNFTNAKFVGCKFDYATFEKTIISREILDSGCPGWDNLKLKFARSLRVNYQELGESKSASRAIQVELEATEIHLYKSWRSNESYYRKKYRGLKRAKKFWEWLSFKVLDFIWGNGESSYKLIRAVCILLVFMAIFDIVFLKHSFDFSNYWQSIKTMPGVFLGVTCPNKYPSWYLTIINFIRLMAVGFFISIIIKRFGRR